MKSLKGKLILDHGKLAGSEFHRTVVLVCQHDAAGAFGLVLNRRTDRTVGESIAASVPEAVGALPVFLGGPVQPQALSFLIREPGMPDANVMSGLHLAHSLDELAGADGNVSPQRQFKFFAGYAGWGPGQLDNEMQRDAWLVHPASLELVFHSQPAELWRSILRGLGGEHRLLADAPDDLSWN